MLLLSDVKVCKTANYQVKSTQTRKTTISKDKTRGTSQDLYFFFVIYLFLSFLACRAVQGGTEFAWIAYLPANILKFMLDRAFPGAAAAAASDAAGAGEAAAACMEAAAAAAY